MSSLVRTPLNPRQEAALLWVLDKGRVGHWNRQGFPKGHVLSSATLTALERRGLVTRWEEQGGGSKTTESYTINYRVSGAGMELLKTMVGAS